MVDLVKKSERMLNVAIVAAAIACAGVWGFYFYATARSAGSSYETGDMIEAVPQVQDAVTGSGGQALLLYAEQPVRSL